jgi:two-component system, NtrC family, response regulator
MKPKLLIVDDDEEIRSQLRWGLAQDYDMLLAEDRSAALAAFRTHRPAVTMLDLGLPPRPNDPSEGLATLEAFAAHDPTAKVIIVSGQNEQENARNAVGIGAYDFLCKPIELVQVRQVLARAFYVAGLDREFRASQQSSTTAGFQGILGKCTPMLEVFRLIKKVAGASAPVLVQGESGTGKEMAAMAIHRLSTRKAGPFVPINCNAIPENLIESELFGHEKGSFTGAHTDRRGLIESAAGGTLFLDEIGELPPSVQVKLLRFLQDQTFHRVGGRQELKGDTRIIAATNANLQDSIKSGAFREDLYFRIAVVVIKLPPLRDRGEDIELVGQAFLERYAVENGRSKLAFGSEALKAVNRHLWPGNLRELQNRVQRAVIMADGRRITPADLELEEVFDAPASFTLKEARENVEREMIERALLRHGGKISPAANELGVSRPTFYELMEKLGIPRTQ